MGHVVIPDVITTIMLEILLLYTAYKTYLNGKKAMAKENAEREKAKLQASQEESLRATNPDQRSLLSGQNKINLSDNTSRNTAWGITEISTEEKEARENWASIRASL